MNLYFDLKWFLLFIYLSENWAQIAINWNFLLLRMKYPWKWNAFSFLERCFLARIKLCLFYSPFHYLCSVAETSHKSFNVVVLGPSLYLQHVRNIFLKKKWTLSTSWIFKNAHFLLNFYFNSYWRKMDPLRENFRYK